MVLKVGLEPTRAIRSQDFKSCASSDFATRAYRNGCCTITLQRRASFIPKWYVENYIKKIFLNISSGAWGRSRTFKHWFLRPTALPICLLTHIRCRGDLIEPLNFSAIVYVNYWSGLSIAIVRIIILAVRFLLPSCTKLTPYQSGLVNVYPDLTLTNGRFCLHNL